jgi:hypothetical protein
MFHQPNLEAAADVWIELPKIQPTEVHDSSAEEIALTRYAAPCKLTGATHIR